MFLFCVRTGLSVSPIINRTVVNSFILHVNYLQICVSRSISVSPIINTELKREDSMPRSEIQLLDYKK